MAIVAALTVWVADPVSAATQLEPRKTDAPACWQQGQGTLRVLIAFASDSGHTAALAREVAAGAATVAGACVWAADVAGLRPDVVAGADAIILGSPVHNSNPAARLLAWVEQWPFRDAPLRDKVGAAFVTAGGISAGEELTQVALLHAMLEFGMVVAGGADWQAAFGAAAISGEAPLTASGVGEAAAQHFAAKARGLGARVATLARRLHPATVAPVSSIAPH